MSTVVDWSPCCESGEVADDVWLHAVGRRRFRRVARCGAGRITRPVGWMFDRDDDLACPTCVAATADTFS